MAISANSCPAGNVVVISTCLKSTRYQCWKMAETRAKEQCVVVTTWLRWEGISAVIAGKNNTNPASAADFVCRTQILVTFFYRHRPWVLSLPALTAQHLLL